MLRRILAIAILAVPTYLSTPARAQTPEEWARCLDTPDCVHWIEYQTTLAQWFDAVNLAVFYDLLVGGDCGGDLPPCYVMERESGGSLTAENPVSTAAGKWQMLIGTSNNVARAMGRNDLVDVPASHWTELEQDEGARLLWNMGAGCSHWSAC